MTELADILHDALTVARRELTLAFQGRRSILLIVGLMVLAALPAAARAAVGAGQDGAALQQAQVLAMVQVFPREVVRYLLDCPQPLIVGILATLFFQPAYVLLVGSETLAGEIESGSIRFSAARASRTGVLLGKSLGLWATIAALTLVVHTVIWVTSTLGPAGSAAGVVRWGPKLYLISCAVALVPVSMVILLGALSSRPRRVIVAGVILIAALRVGRVALANHGFRMATFLPGGLDDRLLSPSPAMVASGIGLALAWAAVLLGAAALAFNRRSV